MRGKLGLGLGKLGSYLSKTGTDLDLRLLRGNHYKPVNQGSPPDAY